MTRIAFALLLAGCGSTLPTKPIADARALVDSTDPHVAAIDGGIVSVGKGLLAVEPLLIAACTGTEPKVDRAVCDAAGKGYDMAQAGHDVAAVGLAKVQEIQVAVDAGLAVLEAMAAAQ